mmetsp:Transcript_26154/g.51154  ORF Transcript_26154/g.51154 Transcript_26154/m.51154 type:complete len:347 (+) Transcript_26154:1-1041(+)
MAKKKRATRRMRKAKLNSEGAEKKAGKQPPARPPSDEELDATLNSCLIELAHHSDACFEFASRCYEKMGRGCLFWLFQDASHAKNMKKDLPCLSYQSKKMASTFEYPPVMEFIKQYDPRSHFVALVAIRTKDHRDSLMKVTHLIKSACHQAVINQPRKMEHLAFQSSKGPLLLSNGHRICSNHLCEAVEKKPDEFKRCGGCKHRQYCSKACQILHWKAIHKTSCKFEREWNTLDLKKEQGLSLRKKEMEALLEVKRLQAMKAELEMARKAQVGVGDITNKKAGDALHNKNEQPTIANNTNMARTREDDGGAKTMNGTKKAGTTVDTTTTTPSPAPSGEIIDLEDVE